ncbi:putative drug exporter of the RND superfamily [Asanoa hainanensis]|uniref:Putative drug exporter of the RND superfamily n=1 Tax=Asanoa hainanensis TaxID=560556 RepID=A0A239IM56_9ACTN|nr:MMPL family transporter [Asanoa hainanensis]SNS94677.1 putative drug exporter of the RND superfamily [Asanoa hainanensis]
MTTSLARFSVRRPVIVLVIWLAVVAAGFTVGVGVFERLVGDVGVVPGSESDRASDRRDALAPAPEEITAIVTGISATDPAVLAAVDRVGADLAAMPGVAEVSPPVAAPDTGRALLFTVTMDLGDDADDVAAQAASTIRAGLSDGTVTVSGGSLSEDEFSEQAASDVARAEIFSTPVMLLLLLIVFGGLLAAGLPLLIAVVGVGGTFGVLFAFSQVTDVSVYSIQIVTMLAVGLAVDYALLVVYRFREERAVDAAVDGAVLRTAATAGRTVLFSGLTVAVALAGLTVFPDPFLRSMGIAGTAVVVLDLLAALTLLPALLALFGKRIKPRAPRPAGVGVFARLARLVQRRPAVTALTVLVAMLFLAIPVLDMRLSGGDARLLPASTQTRALYDELVVHYPDEVRPDEVSAVVAAAPDSPAVTTLRDRIQTMPGVREVEVRPIGDESLVQADVDQEHQDAVATAVRDLPVDSLVGGDAARLIDYRAMLGERMPWAIALVLLGTLLLLFLFTGSIILPIKAVLTNLLSIGAALGAVVWVFQWGNLGLPELDGTNLTVPVLVAAIAFGLSVDYEVFLLSRMRERWLAGASPETAVAEGLQLTGRIVTAAALLLAIVFAGFVAGGFVPIRSVGLGLVLAVLLDATIVRMLLVPATMTLLGRYSWWAPAWLARLHTRFGVTESAPEAAPTPSLALTR